MTKLNWRLAAAFAAALLLLAGVAQAQVQTGNLYGTVSDESGAALPGVTVTLSGQGAPRVQVTNAQGQFRFLSLSPGVYRMEASLEGFSTVEYPEIHIVLGRNTTLEVQLASAVEDVITVTAESPLLDERKITTGATVSQVELEKIPTARDPWSILQSVPGVLVDRVNVGGNESGQQSVFIGPGTAGGDSSWAIDGVEITDPAARGSSPTYYNFEAFEEMAISTGGSDVESRTAGVQVNLVTKRGTNEWRGEGRYLVTDSSYQDSVDVDSGDLGKPGPWNNNRSQPGLAIGAATESVLDWGANLGGPIVKDRLWIWGNYGRQDIEAFKFGAAGAIPDDTLLETYGAKLNAQIVARNSAVLFYNYGDKIKNGRDAGPTRPTETTWNQTGPTDIWKLEDTHIFSSNFFLTLMGSEVGGGFQLAPVGGLGAGAEMVRDAGLVWHNSYILYRTDRPTENYSADGSYFFNTGSVNHELKFGVGFRHSEVTSTTAYPGDMIYALKDIPLGPASSHAYLGIATTDHIWPLSEMDQQDVTLQDTMTFGQMTLNVGLRYDKQDGANTTRPNPASPVFPDVLPAVVPAGTGDTSFTWETITPRLGLTYAMGPERKTLLRASYAQFADQLSTGFFADIGGGAYRSTLFVFYDFNENNKIDAGEVGPWLGPDYVYGDLSAVVNRVDPGLDPKITDEIVLGVEHALLPEFVVGANVTWRETSDLVYDVPFVIENGVLREARRGDFVEGGRVTGTLPDGTTFNEPVFLLRPGVSRDPNQGAMRRNSDAGTEYLGINLTFNKRLANRWMLRGFFNWNEFENDIPAEWNWDPTRGVNEDGSDVLLQSTGSGNKGEVWINSSWSANISGMYQIAPDRPWGFNIAADLNAREGYAIPYRASIAASRAGDSFARTVLVAPENTSFRNPDLYVLNMRIEKEFTFSDFGLTLGIDAFNVLDEQTKLQTEGLVSGTYTRNDGASFALVSNNSSFAREVVSPRILRLGARITFR